MHTVFKFVSKVLDLDLTNIRGMDTFAKLIKFQFISIALHLGMAPLQTR